MTTVVLSPQEVNMARQAGISLLEYARSLHRSKALNVKNVIVPIVPPERAVDTKAGSDYLEGLHAAQDYIDGDKT